MKENTIMIYLMGTEYILGIFLNIYIYIYIYKFSIFMVFIFFRPDGYVYKGNWSYGV